MISSRIISTMFKALFWTAVIILIPVKLVISQPTLGGFLQLDKRFVTGGDSIYIDNFYNRLRLDMNAPIGSQVYLFSSLDFRFYDFPDAQSLSDLERLESEFPYELSIWEAFIDVYGFLFDNLDVRVGKQRIAWGRADKLNPTDNLNPNDFSDLVNFTDMAPSWAVKGTWYIGRNQLTGVWLPGITPVLLPKNGADLFLGDLGALNDELHLPEHTPKNSMFAFRWDGNIDKWDYSVSYFNGYDDIPIATHLTVNPQIQSKIELQFPRMQVIGADLVTELSGIGLWGEAGLFLPEKTDLISEINGISNRETQLKDKPYLKFTVGGDYTFPNGLYLNAQWMHGFDTERGAGQLNDYVVTRVEKEYFNDDVLIALNSIVEMNDWDQMGYGFSPEVTYQTIDNFEATIGAFMIWGEKGTLLNQWKELDQIFIRFRVDF